MGSLNKSHHETTGGVVIFNGELILLYCDAVHCEVEGKGSVTGRIYLTTHRIIFTATPIKQNLRLMSFTAPFFAMFDLGLEQPVFGANYIKGKVRSEGSEPPFSFKLKFNKGGAIEFGQTMSNAAKQAERVAREMNYQAPPPYTPSPTEAFYQASNAYQPSYPIGFALPTQVFNEAPPAGFVFATNAPPPYPGLTTVASQQQQSSAFAPMNPAYQQPAHSPYAVNGNGYTNGAPGYAYGQQFEAPPSYLDATKKQQ